MTTTDDATKWLQDAPARSAQALEMLAPKPSKAGGLVQVKNRDELQAALQDAANRGGGISFDGSVDPVSVDGTIEVLLKDTGDAGPSFFFGGLRLNSTNTDGTTCCIRFKGNTRRMSISNLNVYGGGYSSVGCGNGVEIVSDGGAIWLSKFTDINASYCRLAGIRVQGDVFENAFYSMDCKDNFGNGMEFSNIGGIVSNCMMYGSNLSRNEGYGFALQDGCGNADMFGGSFITNGLGGISAPNGIRSVLYVNGENTGQALINIPFSAYPSLIVGCNLSSSGLCNPAQRDSRSSQFVIMGATKNVMERDCYVTPYGPSPPEMRVRG